MCILKGINPENVFRFFEEISAIPRGSGNTDKISGYCMSFAEKRGLKAERDRLGNVIIYKEGSEGFENSDPIIIQGHVDMVCQKKDGIEIDFEKEGINLVTDGDFIKADGTTLGADNGIAIAIMLAVLDGNYEHPPIEAVFTVDEEVGMLGAVGINEKLLKAHRMINLDSEEIDTVTVSCAGGCDFVMNIPFSNQVLSGTRIELIVRGLRGGHSGVEINSGCVNADILMGRILGEASTIADFGIVSINGGDKGNAIPLRCGAELVVADAKDFSEHLQKYIEKIKSEIAVREPEFECDILIHESGDYKVIDSAACKKLIFSLMCVPNGVMEMSAEISDLVETSLNLGILKTNYDSIELHFTLRSNKETALEYLEHKMTIFAKYSGIESDSFGHYPPWEYVSGSELLSKYIEIYNHKMGSEPKVAALHAGLECGIFSSKIKDLECISIGPQMYDVHTINERLSISSVQELFCMLLELLKSCR